MAGTTLAGRRAAADLARKAFLAASAAKKEADRRLARATADADSANEAAAQAKASLQDARKRYADLKKHAKHTRRKAKELQDAADLARKAWEDAVAGKSSTRQSGGATSGKSPEELKKAADAAQKAADKAEQEACDAEAEAAVAEEELEVLASEHQLLVKEAQAADRRKADAKQAADDAAQAFGQRENESKQASADVLSITVTAEKLGEEWTRVSHLSRSSLTPGYLAIRTPTRAIDADAALALERLGGGALVQAQRERELRRLITHHGLASEVAAITRELNRRRRSEVQTRVLAVSYYETLLYLMSDHSDDLPRPKTTAELELEMKDTDGFVEAVLIYQQDPDDGPLRRFAKELLDIVAQRKKIAIPSELERNLLADQLRARL